MLASALASDGLSVVVDDEDVDVVEVDGPAAAEVEEYVVTVPLTVSPGVWLGFVLEEGGKYSARARSAARAFSRAEYDGG